MLRKFSMLAALAGLFVVTSCTDTAPGPPDKSSSTTASATAGPVSGKTAFWEMYKSAHSWAADLEPLRLESKNIPGIKNAEGKAAMWSATFGSPSRHEARVFTYAVAQHAPDIYKGVTVGQPLPWRGPTRDATVFSGADIAVDSDDAYKTAMTQAASWVEKHPDKGFSCTLGNAERFKNPVWYLIWGDSKSGYDALVDSKTGAIIKGQK